MTLLNHQAIIKSHSQVVNIVDEGDTTTCFDASGNEVTLDEAKYNNLVRLLEMPLRVESLFGIGTTYSPFFMFTHNTDFAKQKKVILYESISNEFFNIESTKAQVSGKNYPHNILKKFCDE